MELITRSLRGGGGVTGSVEDEETRREKRIDEFVALYNKQLGELKKLSLQHHIQLLMEDKERLLQIESRLNAVFNAYANLRVVTKLFIEVPQLHVPELQNSIYGVKKCHYKMLMEVLPSLANYSHTEKEIELTVIRDAMTRCDETLLIKREILRLLRITAKNDLVAMFNVFLIFREYEPLSRHRFVINHILGQFYLRLIFHAIVLINRHLISKAFNQLCSV